MATCKECIHEKVCDALIKSGCPYLDEEIPADAFCIEFRNTADVVPKSEVASTAHKCEDCAGCTQWKCDCANIELEVAREIFEEIETILEPLIQLNYEISVNHVDYIERVKAIASERALRAFRDYVAELKKKYPGVE